MLEDMRVRNLAPRTQESYLLQVSLFARHCARSPLLLGPEDRRVYQLDLANQKQAAPASLRLATAALRFLYKTTLQQPWSPTLILPPEGGPMDRPPLEVGFRRSGPACREEQDATLSTARRRVLRALAVCRTAALGGHVEQCDHCGHLHWPKPYRR